MENVENFASENFETKEIKLGFRKTKIKDKETNVEVEQKRDAIVIGIAVPSVTGIKNILAEGGKQLQLLQEAMLDVILQQAKSLASDDESLTSANFPIEKLTWEAIANMPVQTRRSSALTKEDWEAFTECYVRTMPEVTGKTVENIAAAAEVFNKKFKPAVSNKKIIEALVGQLAVFCNDVAESEQHAGVTTFLLEKAKELLEEKPQSLADNLGFSL